MLDATLSVLGLLRADPYLFDDMEVPEQVDRLTLVDNILMETAELEVLYPDAGFMKFAIGTWSRKEVANWRKMCDALEEEYDPLHNYDRTEEWTDTGNRQTSRETLSRESAEASGSNASQTSTQNSGTSGNTHSVAAYNDADLAERETDTGSTGNTGSADSSVSGSSRTSNSGSENETGKESENNTRSGRAYGNIGVTTSQQMLASEVELRSRFNIYNIIIDSFKRRFCLMVY